MYKEATAPYLSELNINPATVVQKVLFKAQLFVPVHLINTSFPVVNNDCISGFYIHFADLRSLKESSFYIPSKKDWLTEVHEDVDWVEYEGFYSLV